MAQRITEEYKWMDECKRNLGDTVTAQYGLESRIQPVRLRPSAILGLDLGSVHKVPKKFGNLYHFRRWLDRYMSYSMNIVNGSEVIVFSPAIGVYHWDVGFLRKSGEYVSVNIVGVKARHRLLNMEASRKCYLRRCPDLSHIAEFHATLRSIDAYHQYGGACRRCGHTSSLSSR